MPLEPGNAVSGAVEFPSENSVGEHVAALAKLLRESDAFKEALASPDIAALGPKFAAVANQVVTPQVSGHAATVSVNADQARQVLAGIIASLPQERMRAQSTQAMASARDIVQACMIYAADHKDQPPESLDVLVKNGQLSESQLIDPRDPLRRRFIYQPVPNANTGTTLPLIWEPMDDPNQNIVVAFADAHAELMTPARFKEALKVAEEHKAKAATRNAPASSPAMP